MDNNKLKKLINNLNKQKMSINNHIITKVGKIKGHQIKPRLNYNNFNSILFRRKMRLYIKEMKLRIVIEKAQKERDNHNKVLKMYKISK